MFTSTPATPNRFLNKLRETKTFLICALLPLTMTFGGRGWMEFGVALSFCVTFLRYHIKSKESLSLRTPMDKPLHEQADVVDEYSGITFLGNERKRNQNLGKELWLNDSDMKTNLLLLGNCGSGRREALFSLACNAVIQGSGFSFVDATGSTRLYTDIYSMAKNLGREDDVLCINYIRSTNDPYRPKISHTMNPFLSGSANDLTQLICSLMDFDAKDIWQDRTTSMISSLMQPLVFLRDQKVIKLNVEVIIEYLSIHKLIELSKLNNLPVQMRRQVASYLESIPGFKAGAEQQNDTCLYNHEYLQMQIFQTLSLLSKEYAHIFSSHLNDSDIDFTDAVFNRRILVVLLPDLQSWSSDIDVITAKSCRIILATFKAMIGSVLGGSKPDILHHQNRAQSSPYLMIFNECSKCFPQTFAVVNAQCRALGISAVYSDLDYPCFERGSAELAASISANCNVKIALKNEDPGKTFDFFKNASGDHPLKQKELYLMRNGQGHIFFGKKSIPMNFFFPQPPRDDNIRLNEFLDIQTPDQANILPLLQ